MRCTDFRLYLVYFVDFSESKHYRATLTGQGHITIITNVLPDTNKTWYRSNIHQTSKFFEKHHKHRYNVEWSAIFPESLRSQSEPLGHVVYATLASPELYEDFRLHFVKTRSNNKKWLLAYCSHSVCDVFEEFTSLLNV